MPVATKSIEEIKAELEEVRAKKEATKSPPGKKDWHGLVYCDSNGYASIIGKNGQGIWLGKTDEIIPYLKKRHITGERVDTVLGAVEDFWAEKQAEILQGDFGGPRVSKNASCHLATENGTTNIFTPTKKNNRATFSGITLKNDAKLLGLVKTLANQDIGTPTIHKELAKQGYALPYRTVGRWISKIRAGQVVEQ